MQFSDVVPLLGACGVLIGAVSPVVNRMSRLARLRRLNRLIEETPAGIGRVALIDARDALAVRLSAVLLWKRPALLAMLRNAALALALLVGAAVLLEGAAHASWAPSWLREGITGGVNGTLRSIGYWCYLVGGALHGYIVADRRGFIDLEERKRRSLPLPDRWWKRILS